ncbi:hypothetical protein FXB39_07350 [Nocardioides sp. BGMRC 2183]|nr:hypothetical protein FXB39_07350 [Nocardioides sp. BGMRC 2183]
MSGRPRVVLHIGSGKTGTTSIQRLLAINRSALTDAGVLYPRSPGQQRHTRLGLFATPPSALGQNKDWQRGDYPEPSVFRRRFRRRLANEVAEASPRTVVFSDEGLFAAAPATMGNLRVFLADLGRATDAVVYLRRQDDHLISRYQQVVKMGGTRTLADWATIDFSRTYDYAARIGAWEKHLAPDRFAVRPFERERFAQGSLQQDFLDAAGLDLPLATLDMPPRANESIGAEAVEVLRLLNLHAVENRGVAPAAIRNGRLVALLPELDDGPVLTLPEHWLDDFMARWSDGNDSLGQRVDGRRGPLFRTPRRTADTTVEQRLDPVRLDRYLPRLGVPESEWADIRQIAQREATGPG